MASPDRFSWIERPWLAAHARPGDASQLAWLRRQGIQFVISLSENPLRRDWVNDAGLMALHVPVPDLEAPTPEQLDECLSALRKARQSKFGTSVHCTAGIGRTGTVLAAWLIAQGQSARAAMARVRDLRAGSIETMAQEDALHDFARRLKLNDPA